MSVLTRDRGDAFEALGLESPFAEALDAGESLDGRYEALLAEGFDAFEPEAEQSLLRPVRTRGVTFPSGVTLEITTGPTGRDEEHWDPNDSGQPLLATGPSVQPERVSANFTVKEMVTSGGRADPIARISPELVQVLQRIRERAGKSVRITSGYRSWKRNKQVYAGSGKETTKSRHCSGQAADIAVAGMTGIELAKLAIDAAGTDLAIGVGANYIHVDVRGTWTLWTYFKGAADKAAKAEVQGYRDRARRSGVAPKPAPPPPPPAPSGRASAAGGRLVIPQHPMLRRHKGTEPDLILRWNNLTSAGDVDVIVHLHGFSPNGEKMRLDLEKERLSGLDFADPAAPATPGRTRPTVAILPRGNNNSRGGGAGYDFRDLVTPGALGRLIEDCLTRLGLAIGRPLRKGRLILTGHSGGGTPIAALVAEADPDEVHIFDGTYGPTDPIVAWAKRRIARDLATPASPPPALRILYLPGSDREKGTWSNAESAARALCRLLAPAAAARLRPFFRVDQVRGPHEDVAARFGWRLLADAAAELPGVKRFACPGAAGGKHEALEASPYWQAPANAREQSEQESAGLGEQAAFEAYDPSGESSERSDGEELAWLDVEAWAESPITEVEAFEPQGFEPEEFEPEEFEPEAFEPEEFEPEQFEPEEFEPESVALEAFEPEEFEPEEFEPQALELERFDPEAFEAEAFEAEGVGEADRFEPEAWETIGFETPAGEHLDSEPREAFEPGSAESPYAGETWREAEAEGEEERPEPDWLRPSVEQLARQWSQRRKGTPSPEAMRDWLLQDHRDTLAAAWARKALRPHFDAAGSSPTISRAWLNGREEQMRFQLDSATGLKPVSLAPPPASVALESHTLITGSKEAPVAPIVVAFVKELRRRFKSVNASTYPRHGLGAFLNRGHSIDLWLGGRDPRGFFPREPAMKLLRAVDEAARAVGVRWRAIYNDFAVADAINRELGQAHVIFKGDVFRDKHKKPVNVNWHGPDPLIAHFHLDLAPVGGAARKEAEAFEPEGFEGTGLEAALGFTDECGGGARSEDERSAFEGMDRYGPAMLAADEGFDSVGEGESWTEKVEQVAFRDRVLAAHIASRAKDRPPLPDLGDDQLKTVPGSDVKSRADTADAAGRLLTAANADLAKARDAGDADALRTVRLTAISGYRSSDHQRSLWVSHFSDKGGYYDRTRAVREKLPEGPHSDRAAAHMLKPQAAGGFGLGGRIAAPGYSNHQNGIAIDFWQKREKGHDISNRSDEASRAKWRGTWFHAWLKKNAASFGFQPLATEEWHWEFRPKAKNSAAAPKPSAGAKSTAAQSTAAKFIAAHGAAARASQAANGVPALVTLGQAALESGWGKHAPRFNFFGIKAKASDPEASRQLLRTREVFADRNRKFPEIISITPRSDGKFDYVVKDWFRAYPDAAAAFNAHGEFLVRNKRYAKAFAVAGDPYAFAAEVARAGYATDPNYAKVLTNVMRTLEKAGGR